MGDRANVKVVDGDSTVYLYTHWAGTELPATLERALAHQQRWDDGQYLARIIFQEMLGEFGELGNSFLGYGISSVPVDGRNRVLVVDVDKQVVFSTDESKSDPDAVIGRVPFAEFTAARVTDW